jgi:hypothetical protein
MPPLRRIQRPRRRRLCCLLQRKVVITTEQLKEHRVFLSFICQLPLAEHEMDWEIHFSCQSLSGSTSVQLLIRDPNRNWNRNRYSEFIKNRIFFCGTLIETEILFWILNRNRNLYFKI